MGTKPQNERELTIAEPAFATQKRDQFIASGGDPDKVIGLANLIDETLDPKTLDLGARLVNSIGQLLGEEVIWVMENTKRTSADVRIWVRSNMSPSPADDAPTEALKVFLARMRTAIPSTSGCLLVIDQIALVSVTGELYNIIAQRLKKVAPYSQTVVVTIANGKSVGYIPDDAAYTRYTFQVLDRRIKPGCAEQGIINTALDTMEKSRKR
jgi:neutral ceramidase